MPRYHARCAVMTALFRSGTLREKLDVVARLTYEHTINLASFVGVYKSVLLLGRLLSRACGVPVDERPGQVVNGAHAFIAGCVGACVPIAYAA